MNLLNNPANQGWLSTEIMTEERMAGVRKYPEKRTEGANL
jgi:hypothetical protein